MTSLLEDQKAKDKGITSMQFTKGTRWLLNMFKAQHNLKNVDEAVRMLLQGNI